LITLIWVSCAVAILCARYRDVVQLIASILQTAFLRDAVLYTARISCGRVSLDQPGQPFAVFFDHARSAVWILPELAELLIAVVITFGGRCGLGFVGRFCKRVIYWI
jgi:lipopolysaccharide transport system permease protein